MPAVTALRASVVKMMEDGWRPAQGWTVPNPEAYPWLWLWDSCFHTIVWDALGDPRAVTELRGVFRAETASGFLPHVNYADDPDAFAEFWGIPGASTLTQPPMYGHALAVLAAHGHDVASLLDSALRAMRHVFSARRAPCGLLRIFHPWESGIDDHPRWAAWQPDPWDRNGWYDVKGRLVEALVVVDGEAVASAAFDVCSAGFNALAAWNARQLAELTGDGTLAADAADLAATLDNYWDDDLVTWVDATPAGERAASVRTVDALLPALVTSRPNRAGQALRATLDPTAFGLPFGPAGVHRDERTFDPNGYGRGGTWPHLTYLLRRAALERGHPDIGAGLGRLLVAGATSSRLAEYWNPFTGDALGASKQAWTGLAVVAQQADH